MNDSAMEASRLSDQCSRILGRLTVGAVSNQELSRLSLKYTGRISELRQRGHDVRVVSRDRVSGLTLYALFVDGKEVSS